MLRSTRCGLLAAALAFALSGTAHAAATDNWTQWLQTGGDTDTWIRSLSFPLGGAQLYAAGESDGVFQSTDAGIHYNRQISGLPNSGSGVHEVRSTLGAPPLWVADDSGLFTSSDGMSWAQVGDGPGDNKLNYGVNDVYAFSPQTIVAGTASFGIFHSADGGSTWTASSGLGPTTTVFAMTYSGAALYAATSDGMYVSFDQGSSFILHSDGLPGGSIYRVAAVPGDPSHLYATVYGDGVFESTNGGITWNDVSGSGPAVGLGVDGELAGASTEVQDFLLAPAGSGRALIATNGGVFATIDDGATWGEVNPHSNTGPDIDNNDVWALNINPAGGQLVAGTQGYGAYWLPFAPLTNASVPTFGTPHEGQEVTATIGTWHGTLPAIPTFRWQSSSSSTCSSASTINGDDNKPVQGQTYVPTHALANKYIRVQVTVTGLVSSSPVTATSACKQVVADPAAAKPPYIQNSATDSPGITPKDAGSPPWGETYTVSHGTWHSLGGPADQTFTYTYQWERCDDNGCNDITGATGTTYTSTHGDVGDTLGARVTAKNADGGTTVYAYTTYSVIEKNPVNQTPPVIVGSPYIGTTLSSKTGSWDGYNIDYDRSWQACDPDGTDCSPISGGSGSTQGSTAQNDTTASTIPVTEQLRGEIIKLVVTAHNRPGSGSDVTAESAATAVVGDAPVAPPPPPPPGNGNGNGNGGNGGGGGGGGGSDNPLVVSVPTHVAAGSKLSAPASIPGFKKLHYQWLRNGHKIKHATHRTYKITSSDKGTKIACKITATPLAGGKATSYTTPAIKVPGHAKKKHHKKKH